MTIKTNSNRLVESKQPAGVDCPMANIQDLIVEFDEAYVVAGHKGQPEMVKTSKNISAGYTDDAD